MNFTKIIRPGKGSYGNVFCKISYKDGRLSITGVEGPTKNGNARGSCGQISDVLKTLSSVGIGWRSDKVFKFRHVWENYHLNDMQAGTPNQTEYLKTQKYPGYPISHYEWSLKVLGDVGLDVDNGYKYGSGWLYSEVPESILEFLQSLPDTDVTPAWV